MPDSPLHAPLLAWYAAHARTLPWRSPDAGPWAVLVSEVMLQQTQVARVLPAYDGLDGAAGRRPRHSRPRARRGGPHVGTARLPAACAPAACEAAAIDERLRRPGARSTSRRCVALPGVGDYTAAAVTARSPTAGGPPSSTRTSGGCWPGSGRRGPPPGRSVTAAERAHAGSLLPDDAETAATWSVAVMELGALVCAARAPRCARLPGRRPCAWLAAATASRQDRPARKPRLRGHRPAVPRARSSRCCGKPRTPSGQRRRTSPGRTRPNANEPSLH